MLGLARKPEQWTLRACICRCLWNNMIMLGSFASVFLLIGNTVVQIN